MFFVKCRQISNNILIAHEVLRYIISGKVKKNFMAIKLDMSKVYDKVEWAIVIEMIKKCGFRLNRRKWVYECISSVSYNILINGSPRSQITPTRGLQQGDLISSFIFLLCFEGLYAAFKAKERDGSLPSISVRTSSPIISHLLFVDDYYIFSLVSRTTLDSIFGVL